MGCVRALDSASCDGAHKTRDDFSRALDFAFHDIIHDKGKVWFVTAIGFCVF